MALGRQHCRPGCIYSLRPAGIKVRINGSFILFSLQGAGIYVLVPRGWGVEALSFQVGRSKSKY